MTYIGCYLDEMDSDFATRIQLHSNFPLSCFEFARERGFKYVGLKNGVLCRAGNDFGKYGKRNDKECDQVCGEDKTKCGGLNRNSVYSLKGAGGRRVL
jgi:hypothetical protein